MLYLINKPKGISSFDVIRMLRKKLPKKTSMWHTGTLDPLAEWSMLIATNKSTKLIPYIDWSKKTYVFTVFLDGNTASGDLWTEIIHFPKEYVEEKRMNISHEIIKEYIEVSILGKQTQIPPIYSAIHINGKRAYQLARENISLEMKAREIEIYKSRMINFCYPSVTIEVTVSSWTYIRSLGMDIWKHFWLGWYITFLQRTCIHNMPIISAQKIEEFDPNISISYDSILHAYIKRFLTNDEKDDILNGRYIANNTNITEWATVFFIYENQYLGIWKIVWQDIIIIRNNII